MIGIVSACKMANVARLASCKSNHSLEVTEGANWANLTFTRPRVWLVETRWTFDISYHALLTTITSFRALLCFTRLAGRA